MVVSPIHSWFSWRYMYSQYLMQHGGDIVMRGQHELIGVLQVLLREYDDVSCALSERVDEEEISYEGR